jgi:hypothetical protein
MFYNLRDASAVNNTDHEHRITYFLNFRRHLFVFVPVLTDVTKN